MSHERRRAERFPTPDWSGRYRIADESIWHDCRVVDLSLTGVALEVEHLPAARTDDPIRVEVELHGPSHDAPLIRLGGVIRRRNRSVIGVQFVLASARQRELLFLSLIEREPARRHAGNN